MIAAMVGGNILGFLLFASVINSHWLHKEVFLVASLPSGGLFFILLGFMVFPKGSDRRLGFCFGGAVASLMCGGCAISMLVR